MMKSVKIAALLLCLLAVGALGASKAQATEYDTSGHIYCNDGTTPIRTAIYVYVHYQWLDENGHQQHTNGSTVVHDGTGQLRIQFLLTGNNSDVQMNLSYSYTDGGGIVHIGTTPWHDLNSGTDTFDWTTAINP